MKKKRSLFTIPAYFFMPISFAVIVCILLVIALSPVRETVLAAANLFVTDDGPVFDTDLHSIYDPDSNEAEKNENGFIKVEDINMPASGTCYGKLSCSEINLDAPVYWGDSAEILRAGVGQHISTFLPGFGRLIIIAGHNSTYFKPLQNIGIGDVINFDTNYCNYEYKVTDVAVMDEKALNDKFLENMGTEEEKLYLYTCYPFTPHVGRRTDRFLVTAERVSGYNVKWRASQDE